MTQQISGAWNRRQWLGLGTASAMSALCGPALAQSSEDVVRIGQVLPLSGPVSAVTLPIVEGQTALLSEINAKGGVHGNRIELITLDDGFDPKNTVSQTTQLLEKHKVSALFGYATGPGIGAILPMLAEHRVPLLAPYNGADQLRAKHHPYLFTTTASFMDEVGQMIRTLATLKSTRIAVSVPANDIGRDLLATIQVMAKEAGLEVVAAAETANDGSNAADVVQRLLAKEPMAILLLAAGAPMLAFMKAITGKSQIPVYALSVAGSSALKALGPAARGLIITQVIPFPWRTTSPLTRQLAASLGKAKLDVSYDRMWGYLNASILVEVLRRTGRTPAPATIVSALENMNDVDIGGYRLNFSKTRHHGSRFVEITMIGSRGEYVR